MRGMHLIALVSVPIVSRRAEENFDDAKLMPMTTAGATNDNQ